MAVAEDARNHDEDAGRGEGRSYEFQVAEEIFDLRVRQPAEYRPLDDDYDAFADHRRAGGRDDDKPRKAPEGRGALEIGAAPLRPEVRDDREHRAGVQH